MSRIMEILTQGYQCDASDVHLTVGRPPVFRINGALTSFESEGVSAEELERYVMDLLPDERQHKTLEENGEVDFSFGIAQVSRFRVNVYRQRKSYCIAARVLRYGIPPLQSLGVADCVERLCDLPRGLILVTGPTGSGKSTTLASMVDYINQSRRCHILTIEDPIEYLHRHNQSLINQREVGDDTLSFSAALRAALREDPDVILVGEMRDLETISIALTAAETGHLVLSTLHTAGAAQTIDRLIDVFPPNQQQQIRIQLAGVLQAILSQQLIPTADGKKRVLVQEALITTDAVRNIIRENKVHMLSTTMQTGAKLGMQTMDAALSKLVAAHTITYRQALSISPDPETLRRYVNGN